MDADSDEPDAQTQELRRVSRELLGSKYRLEVAVAVRNSRRKTVYARGLIDSVPGAGDNQVGECLKHFEEGGLRAQSHRRRTRPADVHRPRQQLLEALRGADERGPGAVDAVEPLFTTGEVERDSAAEERDDVGVQTDAWLAASGCLGLIRERRLASASATLR